MIRLGKNPNSPEFLVKIPYMCKIISTKRLEIVVLFCIAVFVIQPALHSQASVIEKATKLWGQPIRTEPHCFELNHDWVIWLITDNAGDLFEAAVGPKSFYTHDFGEASKTGTDFIDESNYQAILQQVSQVKDLGKEQAPHQSAIKKYIGIINTDWFENAFSERFVESETAQDHITHFDIHFARTVNISPEELVESPLYGFICSDAQWFYVPEMKAGAIQLGISQKLKIAGPSDQFDMGCHKTTTVYDEEGFTKESTTPRILMVNKPFRVRALKGLVSIAPDTEYQAFIPDAHVEFLSAGSQKMYRTLTNSEGKFSIPHAPQGQYKFKVTKSGFNILSGTVIIDSHAPKDAQLVFVVSVGT